MTCYENCTEQTLLLKRTLSLHLRTLVILSETLYPDIKRLEVKEGRHQIK